MYYRVFTHSAIVKFVVRGGLMNFRKILNKFCLVSNVNKPETINGLPYNGFLGYSFINSDFGLSFYVIALTYYHKGNYAVSQLMSEKDNLIVRYEDMQPDLSIIIQKNKALDFTYSEIVKKLRNQYCVDKDIEECRQIYDIDDLRKTSHPDLIKAYVFSAEGGFLENIEVLTRKYLGSPNGQHYIVVQLLEEPYRNIGVHQGDLAIGVVTDYGQYGYVLGIPVNSEEVKRFNEILVEQSNLDDIANQFRTL